MCNNCLQKVVIALSLKEGMLQCTKLYREDLSNKLKKASIRFSANSETHSDAPRKMWSELTTRTYFHVLVFWR